MASLSELYPATGISQQISPGRPVEYWSSTITLIIQGNVIDAKKEARRACSDDRSPVITITMVPALDCSRSLVSRRRHRSFSPAGYPRLGTPTQRFADAPGRRGYGGLRHRLPVALGFGRSWGRLVSHAAAVMAMMEATAV